MIKISILVIENDTKYLDLIKDTLEKVGFSVFTATRGDVGISLTMNISPSLILLNLATPGTNGLELCKSIHGMEEFKDLPILLLTLKEGKFNPIYTTQYGIVDFLKKPFSENALIENIKNILGIDDLSILGSPEKTGDAEKESGAVEEAPEEEEAPDEEEDDDDDDDEDETTVEPVSDEAPTEDEDEDDDEDEDEDKEEDEEEDEDEDKEEDEDETTVEPVSDKAATEDEDKDEDETTVEPVSDKAATKEALSPGEFSEMLEEEGQEGVEDDKAGKSKILKKILIPAVIVLVLAISFIALQFLSGDSADEEIAKTRVGEKRVLPATEEAAEPETSVGQVGTIPSIKPNIVDLKNEVEREAAKRLDTVTPHVESRLTEEDIATGQAAVETPGDKAIKAPEVKPEVKVETAPVKELATAAPEVKKPAYLVQFGFFGSRNNAEKMVNLLKGKGIEARILKGTSRAGKTRFRVVLGKKFGSSRSASAKAQEIAQKHDVKTAIFHDK